MAVPAIAVLVGWTLSGPAQAQNTRPPDAAGEVLTLDQAITMALRENHGVKSAQLSVEKAAEEIAAARTARLPKLNVYSLLSQGLVNNSQDLNNPLHGVLPGVGEFFTISTQRKFTSAFAAQVMLPLAQQRRIGLGVDLARLERQQEQEKLRSARQTLVDDVKRSYYGILQTESGLNRVRETVKSYRELDRVTVELVSRGAAIRADRLQVETNLAKAESEQAELKNRLATQKEQLNSLLGRDVFTEYRVLPVPEATLVEADLQTARRRALAQRPELREARLRIEQAQTVRGIRKSAYTPDVSLGLTALTLRNFDAFVPKDMASIGVAVKWEVWDWGRRRHEVAAASKDLEQARNGLHEVEDQVLIDVSDKLRKLEQSRLDLRVAQLGEATAREMLQVNTDRYKVQAVVLADVLQAQAALAGANHQYQQALLAFWGAKAGFEKALGEER
jgi:outer membrane protein TolC